MSKSIIYRRIHHVKVLSTTKWRPKLRESTCWKQKLATLIIQLVPLQPRFEVPPPAVALLPVAVLAADAIWIFSLFTTSILGTVKTCLTGYLALWLYLDTRRFWVPSRQIWATVSSVANAGHADQLFKSFTERLLLFIRTQVVGDFTAARVNDSACRRKIGSWRNSPKFNLKTSGRLG